jgi:hypothetical protein
MYIPYLCSFSGFHFQPQVTSAAYGLNHTHCRVAPLDGKRKHSGTDDEYQTLINIFEIPEEFVWEREQSVTHSFGRQVGDRGRMSESYHRYSPNHPEALPMVARYLSQTKRPTLSSLQRFGCTFWSRFPGQKLPSVNQT